MTDLFAQEGITFEHADYASTAPSAEPTPITAPKIDLPNNDNAPIVSNAPKGSPLKTPEEQNAAMRELYPDSADAPVTEAPMAPALPSRDLFAEQGIEPPTVTQANGNAFMDGVPLNTNTVKTIEPDTGVPTSSSFAPISRSAMSQVDFGDAQLAHKNVQDYAATDDAMIMKLASQRFSPAQIEEWKNNPIGMVEGFQRAGWKAAPVIGGIDSLSKSLAITRIGEKAKAGETLTPEEQGTLNAFLDNEIEQRVRGWSWGGNVAYIGSQIPAFVIEFALSDGAGKAAQLAIKKGAEEAAIHGAVATSVAAASRVAITPALMPGQYAPKYGERRVNDIMSVSDKGELILKNSEESPAMSALLAYGHTAADVAAQIAAPTIGQYVVDPAKKLVSTPLVSAVNKLPMAVKENLYQAYKVIKPNAKISEVLTSAGWSGMLEQLGANRVADILHASLDLSSDDKMTMSQYLDRLTPSKDQLLVEAGLIGIAGGIHSSANVALNLMKSKGVPTLAATEAVDNMTAIERDNFVNDNLPTPESAYPTVPETGDLPTDARGAYITDYQMRLDGMRARFEPVVKKPLLSMIKQMGGVKPDSQLAGELRSMGIKPNTAPGLYNREGTAGDMDNIPVEEFNTRFGVNAPDGGNGYVDRNWILDKIREETFGRRIGATEMTEDTGFERLLSEAGLDHRTATGEQLYAALGPEPEIKLEAARLGENVTPQDALDIRALMDEHGIDATAAIERFAERQAMQYGDQPQPRQLPDTVTYDGDAVKNQTTAAEADEPPPINNEESTFNYLNRALFNRGAAAEEPFNNAVKAGFTPKALENTPILLSLNHQTPELARSHMMVNTFRWDEEGKIVNTGKSLKAILDDHDNYFVAKEPNRETRRQEFNDFLIARHYLSLPETAPHVLVTPEQLAKAVADMEKLVAKYGEDAKMFDTLGNEFVEYRNRTRDLLVGNLLTKDQRAREKEMYPYSVPLKREITPKEYEAAISAGDYASLNPGNLTKRLKGSALPVKDILHSTMRESARTIDFVMRNRVNRSIYNLREYAPDKVQETTLPIVKTGTAEFSISFDPKLREKLEKAVEFLGGSVARGEGGKIGLDKKSLGSYSPEENLVRMRIGSTEGTLAHEVGHMLDHKLDLKKRMLSDPEIKKELQKLAEDRLSGEHELVDTLEGMRFKEEKAKAGKKYEQYIKNNDEILANFFDAYVNSPEQLDAVAPNAKAAFEAIIDDNPQIAFLRDIKPSTSRTTEKVKKDVYGNGDLPPNTFAFWENGEKKFVKVSKPMFDSLSSMRPSQLSSAAKFFTTTFRLLSAARALTFGATNTPEFILRNPVRDSLEATVQSGVGYNAGYIPKTLYKMLTRSPEYKEFVQAGGKFASYMALDDANIEKTFADILNPKSKFRKIISNPIEAYEQLPKASETLTRFGVYRAALDKGYSPVESAQYALDATLNFPRGGFAVKAANNYMPFLNVGFLATERLVRAIKADPKTVALRGITFITAPALITAGYYLYGADEETRKEWLELPINHIAEGRVYFKYNGEWRYIPTPYAIGYLFSGLPQLALRETHENSPDDGRAMWEHMMKGFIGAVSPVQDYSSLMPPTIKVALEDISNFDYYRGRNIYSKFKEGDQTLNKDKANAYDSETAKAMGNIFNTSPALIDHTVYGLFGGSGGYALKASDYAINTVRRARGENVPEKPQTGADIPVVAAFTSRSPEGTRSNSYQGWQRHYYDVQAIAAHLKGMDAGEDKAAYQQENARVIAQQGQLKGASKVIQNRLKQIRAITTDPHMSSEQKTERIATLEKEITRVARNSNNQYNAAISAGK